VWSRQNKSGKIYLAPRTFLELGELVASYDLELPQVLYY
jgi:hypothetical protein